MTARILVVDDIEPNVRLLEAKLTAEYYEVLTAYNGVEALAKAAAESPDIILLDVMMPGMDGFQVCRRLKDDIATRHIPVVLITALDGREDRIAGLEAGADEFLTKPIDDVMLLSRVRSLTRLKLVIDELRQREASGRRMGVIEASAARQGGSGGRVAVFDDNERQGARLIEELSIEHRAQLFAGPEGLETLPQGGHVDLYIVNAVAKSFDGLRLAARIRSEEAARHVPILAMVDVEDRPRVVKALEIGVNDLLPRPVDPQELSARARTQIKRKRYTDFLRHSLDHSLELAVIDQLTGLYNRRYMTAQLTSLMSRRRDAPMSLLLVDIDHFKPVNDTYGHDAGDEVLREFAVRLANNVRTVDLACRYGGEEFVVLMPDTEMVDAHRIAERIRRDVAGSPFRVRKGAELLNVTISIGVAVAGPQDGADSLLKRADEAVYRAKAEGRNRVIAKAAA
ncbi:MAG TPA: PleD family two-component system response regulator [Caulobacteraceae bacterium]|jgi:two-component system cell cycle response regulator